jgi:hypothetical protein
VEEPSSSANNRIFSRSQLPIETGRHNQNETKKGATNTKHNVLHIIDGAGCHSSQQNAEQSRLQRNEKST